MAYLDFFFTKQYYLISICWKGSFNISLELQNHETITDTSVCCPVNSRRLKCSLWDPMNIFETKPKFCFLIELCILLYSSPTLSTVKGDITYLLGLEYVLCRQDWSVEGDGIFFFQVYEISLQWLGGFTGFYTGRTPSYMIAAHIKCLTTTMEFFHIPIFWKPSI